MFKNHDCGGPRTGYFKTRGGGRERERDVRERLLKCSDSRPPKAELHEIYEKFKSYVIL